MYRRLMVFVVLSIIGAASIYNVTTFEASAQGGGGIMGLVPNAAEDVYLTEAPKINFSKNFQYQRPLVETPPSNPSSSASEQSPPSGASGGLMGLIANSAQGVYTPGGTLSCSEGQVLDEQSGFCVPKELETAEEQPQAAEEQPQAAEEQPEQSQLEQPEQQSSDDEGDGLEDNSNDDNSGNDEDDN
jgi:hypothetical protein